MNKQINAEIISVGTELLLGDILNTNAQFLSQELAKLGINLFFQTVAGDNPKRLYAVLETAFSRADLVITTGGLGPTGDDLTKETGAEYFSKKLVMHDESLDKIKSFFASINQEMTENNIKQAMLPEGCIVLTNNNGTAPGCVIEDKGKILIMLPGPPNEMVQMYNESVEPYLRTKTDEVLISRTLLFSGIGESALEGILLDLMQGHSNPTVAPYAKQNGVTVRITAKAHNNEEADILIAPVADEIYKRLGKYIYGEGDMSLEQAVIGILQQKKYSIACAESCTGGMLASSLVDVPGVSDVLLEGIVSYSNRSKIERLGVSEQTLEKHGAVSHETAAEMAAGAAKFLGADIGISTTGIAGPGGGTKEKPVGLVYVGIYINGEIKTEELRLFGNRKKIRERTVARALHFLLNEIR